MAVRLKSFAAAAAGAQIVVGAGDRVSETLLAWRQAEHQGVEQISVRRS